MGKSSQHALPACVVCGEPVSRPRSRYCSRSCMGLDRKKAVKVTCPCGAVFEAKRAAVNRPGCGRYCSRACMYKYRVRPSGLTYNITEENAGWFKPGERPFPDAGFKPGQAPWNKGIPTGITPANAFEPGHEPWNKGVPTGGPAVQFRGAGEANPNWAGDDVGYDGLHKRVYKERGRAADYICQRSDETCKGPMHWANVSGRYEGIEDFAPMCQSHHFRYDRARERQ